MVGSVGTVVTTFPRFEPIRAGAKVPSSFTKGPSRIGPIGPIGPGRQAEPSDCYRARMNDPVIIEAAINGATKTAKGRREIGLPSFLVELLKVQVAGKQPDDLVFTGPNGAPLRHSKIRSEPTTLCFG